MEADVSARVREIPGNSRRRVRDPCSGGLSVYRMESNDGSETRMRVAFHKCFGLAGNCEVLFCRHLKKYTVSCLAGDVVLSMVA